MFDNILISSLLSMDDEKLQATLESMSYEELSYIDAAMEAKYTEQDLVDFQDMMRIQNAAHRDGWKNVSKDDYDRYVDIMTNTKHLMKMRQAKKLGREKAIIDRDKQYIQGDSDVKSHIGNKIDDFKGTNAIRAGFILGGPIGGWGVKGGIALAKAFKDSVRFDDDRKGLRERGIKNHPDEQWQINRAKNGLKKLKHELTRPRYIIPRKDKHVSTDPATESAENSSAIERLKAIKKKPETRLNKIDRMIEIQKQARAKGWHNIEAKDRKYYIDTINSARGDKEFMRDLKRAKKIGNKAGDVDSNVLKATRAMALPAISVGGAIGNMTAEDTYGKLVRATQKLPDELRGNLLPTKTHFTTAMGIGGTTLGALANVGIQKIGEKIDQKRRHERDLARLKELGEGTHPEDAWKKRVEYTKIPNKKGSKED